MKRPYLRLSGFSSLSLVAAFVLGCATATAVKTDVKPAHAQLQTRWQYTCLPHDGLISRQGKLEKMNQLGQQGWELVTINAKNNEFCFKRPL